MDKKLFNPIKYSILALFFGVLLIVSGCEKTPGTEPDPDPTGEVTNTEINQWIVENMRDIYYWNTSIPNDNRLNFNSSPPNFFESLLHQDDDFSWIQPADELVDNLGGVSRTVGIGMGLILLQNEVDVIISVRYALAGSPADIAGIERGEIITGVNGTGITINNYRQLIGAFSGESSFSVQMARIEGNIEGNNIVDGRKLTLTPVANFQEQAIHLDSILTTPSGRKVGYLFYNRFLNNQPNELLAVFNRFKNAGIEDLVLDLRYNGGGGIWISAILAGLIQRDFKEGETFIHYKYNSNYRDESRSYFSIFGGDSPDPEDRAAAQEDVNAVKALNLNLPRLYVIATDYSASASELIINNLRPFLSHANVIHIGGTTVGKNEGSVSILDNRTPRRIDWGLQPIVVKLANKDGFGDYPEGLVPQHNINEIAYLPWVPLGSLEDPMLAKALTLIDPSLQAVVSRSMSVKAQTAFGLGLKEVEGFQDPQNKPVPVDITETSKQRLSQN